MADYLRQLLALVVFAATLAVAQSETGERSSSPLREMTRAQLLQQLRGGGLILYFRHTSTDFSQSDDSMTSYDDCARQRNLTGKGRDEAKAIGDAIRRLAIPIGTVLASPYCRTMETAQLAFGKAHKSMDVRGGPAQPTDPNYYAPLRKVLTTPVAGNDNLVVSSHGNPFRYLAGPPHLSEGEAAVLRPTGQDFEVIGRIRLEDWQQF